MFESALEDKLKGIFKVKKVTYSAPSKMNEQEVLFVEIESAKPIIKDKIARAVVQGTCTMNGKNDKLTFGFFGKAIKQADPTLTKDLAFFDLEGNVVKFQDLVQRSFSFRYFFDSQYDPKVAKIEIDKVEIDIEEQ